MRITACVLWSLIINVALHAQPGYRESIKLTTDRELYFAGEKIWFHAIASSDTELLSSVLYVELYDQQHNSVVRGKYRIDDNLATGFINIPLSAATGNYLLRVYTHYSRNFHPQTQTTLLVSIVNPLLPVSEYEVPDINQVFAVPEGTALIAGTPARLAVRLVPYKGIDQDEIRIISDTSSPVASCKPFSNGIALLEFTPQKGESYKLVIRKHSGEEIFKNLDVEGEGVSIKPEIIGNILKISWQNPLTGYRIKVISHGGISILDSHIEGPGPIEVPLNNYNDKLAYCILQNGSEIIRVHTVFTGHMTTKSVEVHTDSVYHSRQMAVAGVNLPTGYKGSILASVAYNGSKGIRLNQIPWYTAYNSAFFSGAMNNVTRVDAETQKQIDALMILYSGFLKNTGVNNRETAPALHFLPELRDAQISGRVVYKVSRLPVADLNVFCSVLDSSGQFHINKTGTDGRFWFTLNHLTAKEHRVYLCTQGTDSVELLIDSDFDTRYPESAAFIPFLPDTSNLADLNRIFRNSQLNRTFPEYAAQISEKRKYHPILPADAVHNIVLADFIEMPVMEEIFSEIVPFTTVRKRSDDYYLQLYDERSRYSMDDPLIILDGIPFFDVNQIMTIIPEMVQKIELTNRLVHLGNNTLNGIVRIVTDTKNFAGLKLPPSSRFISFMGINDPATPVFPTLNDSETSRIPDFRTLLYWDPFVIPDQKVSFYTSDAKGEYTITVSGTDGTQNYTGTASFKVR